MAEHRLLSMEEVEAALADLARHIDHPPTGDLAPAVVVRLATVDRVGARPRWQHVAVAAALLVVVVLALPAPRRAVADWLGIGTVRVVRTDQVPVDTGSDLRLGDEVSLTEARRTASFEILAPGSLDEPSAISAGEPAGDSVTLVWGPGEGIPAVGETGVGLLLTEMAGTTDRTLIEKELGPGTLLETTTVGDEMAYWISGGPHELRYVDPGGTVRLDTTRLAANTLVWEHDGVTFRLESALDEAAAVEMAQDLEPVS